MHLFNIGLKHMTEKDFYVLDIYTDISVFYLAQTHNYEHEIHFIEKAQVCKTAWKLRRQSEYAIFDGIEVIQYKSAGTQGLVYTFSTRDENILICTQRSS